MKRTSDAAATAQVILAVLGVMAALHLMKSILVPVALAMLLAPAPTCAADPTPSVPLPVTVHASVDRTQVTIGDPIRYTVEVSAAADTEVLIPVLSGTLGEFSISDFGELPSRTEHGRIIVARWYTLTIFVTGDQFGPRAHGGRCSAGCRPGARGPGR